MDWILRFIALSFFLTVVVVLAAWIGFIDDSIIFLMYFMFCVMFSFIVASHTLMFEFRDRLIEILKLDLSEGVMEVCREFGSDPIDISEFPEFAAKYRNSRAYGLIDRALITAKKLYLTEEEVLFLIRDQSDKVSEIYFLSTIMNHLVVSSSKFRLSGELLPEDNHGRLFGAIVTRIQIIDARAR